MGLIIDTNVFVLWERGGHKINFSPWKDHGDAAMSVMTASELLVGVHRADSEARRQNNPHSSNRSWHRFLFWTLPGRLHVSMRNLFADLASRGEMIGAHDLIIAATAKHDESSILTTNIADFKRVPNLKVIELKM